MNNINHLLLSDSYDFTTDLVSIELHKRGANYLRLNRDLLNESKMIWDISSRRLTIAFGNDTFLISEESLKSIYYRAPTYLRETFSKCKSAEDQLKQSQWISFYRNLLCFKKAKWINSPSATFSAENKMLQLQEAEELGLRIPSTFVCNTPPLIQGKENLIIKSLDTAVLNFGDKEGFVYTNTISSRELAASSLSLAPVIIQENISPKIDIRVTVIGEVVFPVEILIDGAGAPDDWRKQKDDVTFITTQLPTEVARKCSALIKRLNLSFGAIDLIRRNEDYYFIEVNPTGEWAWLVDTAGIKIHEAICDYMMH